MNISCGFDSPEGRGSVVVVWLHPGETLERFDYFRVRFMVTEVRYIQAFRYPINGMTLTDWYTTYAVFEPCSRPREKRKRLYFQYTHGLLENSLAANPYQNPRPRRVITSPRRVPVCSVSRSLVVLPAATCSLELRILAASRGSNSCLLTVDSHDGWRQDGVHASCITVGKILFYPHCPVRYNQPRLLRKASYIVYSGGGGGLASRPHRSESTS